MRRPGYSDALEHILEAKADELDRLTSVPKAQHQIITRWEVVGMAARLWDLERASVAENVIRLHRLRVLFAEGSR